MSKLTVIAIVFIITGLIPLAFGISKIIPQNYDQTIKEFEDITISSNDEKEYPFRMSITENNSRYDQDILVRVEPFPIFEGDTPIISASLPSVKNNINMIALLFTESENDLRDLSARDFRRVLNEHINNNRALVLDSTTIPPFTDKKQMSFGISDKTVQFYIFYMNNEKHELYNAENKLFTIQSTLSKIQMQTNQAMLQQIFETRQNTISQEKTNMLILGLTLIGTGFLPIMLGADILLRIYKID